MTIPIMINRKLLHVILPSNLNFEHPRCSIEVIDRKTEVPMMKTNLQQNQLLVTSHWQSLLTYYPCSITYYIPEMTAG